MGIRLQNGAKECILQISAKAFQLIFTCKIWLRYSRERALSSLPALRVQIPQVRVGGGRAARLRPPLAATARELHPPGELARAVCLTLLAVDASISKPNSPVCCRPTITSANQLCSRLVAASCPQKFRFSGEAMCSAEGGRASRNALEKADCGC